MKYCKTCNKTKALVEFAVDNSRKDGHFYKCKQCCSSQARSPEQRTKRNKRRVVLQQENPSLLKEESHRYYLKNKEKISTKRREKYQQNPTPAKKRRRKRYLLKRQECLDYAKKWAKENQDKVNEASARRRVVLNAGYVTLLAKKDIKELWEIYELARLSDGLLVVDHILPARGPIVPYEYPYFDEEVGELVTKGYILQGLHVPWNLQLLSFEWNSKKSNQWDGTIENWGWLKDVQVYGLSEEEEE